LRLTRSQAGGPGITIGKTGGGAGTASGIERCGGSDNSSGGCSRCEGAKGAMNSNGFCPWTSVTNLIAVMCTGTEPFAPYQLPAMLRWLEPLGGVCGFNRAGHSISPYTATQLSRESLAWASAVDAAGLGSRGTGSEYDLTWLSLRRRYQAGIVTGLATQATCWSAVRPAVCRSRQWWIVQDRKDAYGLEGTRAGSYFRR
jgi:hypothetical protein